MNCERGTQKSCHGGREGLLFQFLLVRRALLETKLVEIETKGNGDGKSLRNEETVLPSLSIKT